MATGFLPAWIIGSKDSLGAGVTISNDVGAEGIGVPDCIRSARQAVAKITSVALQPASV